MALLANIYNLSYEIRYIILYSQLEYQTRLEQFTFSQSIFSW